MANDHFYTITGGPGSGKTALIDELKRRGYKCVQEVARQVIQEQMAINGEGLPWKNLPLFKKMLLDRSIETYHKALESSEITFFDRDVLELIAYDRHTVTESSDELYQAVHTLTYNKRVFVAPPWKEIYCNDRERKQTYDEAIRVYNNIVSVNIEFGREIIKLPQTTVCKRADFVIIHLTKNLD